MKEIKHKTIFLFFYLRNFFIYLKTYFKTNVRQYNKISFIENYIISIKNFGSQVRKYIM